MLEREIREMAFVPRWSIVRTNRQQYLAEHTYFVCMYANDIAVELQLTGNDIAPLLQMALWHDVEEIFSGDLPGPAKRSGMGDYRKVWDGKLRGWLDKVFDRLDRRSGNAHHLTPLRIQLLEAILKLADYIDECSEMGTEIQMGNRNCSCIFGDSLMRVRDAIEEVVRRVPHLVADQNAAQRFRGKVVHACLSSRDGESRNTRIFDTL